MVLGLLLLWRRRELRLWVTNCWWWETIRWWLLARQVNGRRLVEHIASELNPGLLRGSVLGCKDRRRLWNMDGCDVLPFGAIILWPQGKRRRLCIFYSTDAGVRGMTSLVRLP
jgi:hypothetical protein